MSNLDRVLELANHNLFHPCAMASSARLCYADALAAAEQGNAEQAFRRAIKSLAYTVGVFGPAYAEAWRLAYGTEVPVGHSSKL